MANEKLKNLVACVLILAFIPANFLVISAQGIPELPAEVREQISEKDFLEVFCLTTKWKSGEFFSSMDALQEILEPALQKLRSVDLEAEMPDIAAYKARGQEKVNAICQAATWEEAQDAVDDLLFFGESVREDLDGINNSLSQNLKAKGEELKNKVTAQIDAWVEEEKNKMQSEIEKEIDQLANQLRIQLEQQAQTMGFASEEAARAFGESGAKRIEATVEARVSELLGIKEADLKARINNKMSEIIGMPVEQFRAIGDEMANIEGAIEKKTAENLAQYEQYKIQAMEKRSKLIAAVLDKKIEEAITLIQEKSSLLDEAKLNDPAVKTADEYIAELQADKNILTNKIYTAVQNENETGIDEAINEMKQKWLNIRSELEADLAKRQTPAEICSLVIPQIDQAKIEIENGFSQTHAALEEINLKKDECGLSPDKTICQKVENIYEQLLQAREKSQTFAKSMESVQSECSLVTEETPMTEEFLNAMIWLRDEGPQWKKEVTALKNQWLKDKNELEKELAKKPDVETICSLKELATGKIEAERRLDDLNERLKRCNKPCLGTVEACITQAATCNLYRVKSAQFDAAIEKGEDVLAKFAVIDQKCADPSVVSLTEIISLAKETQQLGEEFLNLRKLAIN